MTNKESLFAGLHILMRAILMAQRTLAAGFADTGIEKATAKSTPAGKYKISVNPVNLVKKTSCLGVFVAIIPFNQRNLRLINDLRPFKSLYNCKEAFTDVMSALQNNLFMQNKANFQKVKLNVTKVLTRNYVQMDTWSSGKKQSQTNPNKAKLKKAKMNVTSIITKAYENKPPILAPKKQSQISKRQKPMQTLLTKRIMKKTRFWAPKKQTQFKPNLSRRSLWRSRKQTQFQTNLGLLKLVSTSRMIKSYLNIVGSPCVIAGKTRLTIRKETFSISHAKTGNRVRFRN